MGLLDYERQFANLRMNTAQGHVSPHKVAMLLAVIDGIQSGEIGDDRIFFSKWLRSQFTLHFKRLASPADRDSPHLPFFHLRTESFWHHQIKPGKRAEYSTLRSATSSNVIDRCIQYAYLDDELFELLGNSVVAELLRTALLTNLEDSEKQEILSKAPGWDWLECELIVKDYLEMLSRQLKGKSYNKAANRRALQPRLNNRSEGAIEYKHQNISAVLLELGLPYLPGYRPAFNYQAQLKQVVLAHIAREPTSFDALSGTAEDETVPPDSEQMDWSKVFDPDPPERLTDLKRPPRKYLGRKLSYSERERLNRELGTLGEGFAVEFEKYRLTAQGRPDLAKEVEWSSRDRGDGLGYDIRSFEPEYDSEVFVEVKTTNSGKYQPFLITENERSFSNDFAGHYRLYRIYEFRHQPRLFMLHGAIEENANLVPQQYRAIF